MALPFRLIQPPDHPQSLKTARPIRERALSRFMDGKLKALVAINREIAAGLRAVPAAVQTGQAA